MKSEQQAVVSPPSWPCLEGLSSSAQHPLGVSLPSQEIGSGCSGLSVLFGASLLHFSLVGFCVDFQTSAHSKATHGPNEPFQGALGFTWYEEQDSAVSLWFLWALRSFRWLQCEGAANPLLGCGINSSLLECCRSDYGGRPCQST